MTEIRYDEGVPHPASIRLRALEVVAETWGDSIGSKETLETAKEYAEWIEQGATPTEASGCDLCRKPGATHVEDDHPLPRGHVDYDAFFDATDDELVGFAAKALFRFNRMRGKQAACTTHGDSLSRQIAETMEVAAELAKERTSADEMTRAVKRLVGERDRAIAESAELAAVMETVRNECTRLVGERDDALAEAEGARDDYEQLKGFNAELAAERDRLRQELDQMRQGEKLARPR